MAQEIITLENLAAEIAKLRGELATWKALAIKQDRLSTAQMLAVNSGATAGKIAQIATNTSDIAALQQIASSAFRVVKVAQLPASGEPYIMYLVPQTDGETLNYCNEYLWIDNAWELVGTTGAMANNGELQIIVNGVTVGTFTANQATNSTASITVPTDTSQLTNGAGYVDATALATALASKQNSLSLTQLAAVNSGITSTDVAQIGANTTAIAGKQDALTTSQLAAVNSGITSADVTQIGTNTGNIATNSAAIVSLQGSKQNALSAAQLLAVNSGITSSLVTQIGTNQSDITTLNTALGQSLAPSADNTYSLGGASFRYANVYAVTFTGDLVGTASKAIADEDGTSIKTGYVNVAGNQTVSGQKTWTQAQVFQNNVYLANTSYTVGTIPTSNITSTCFFSGASNYQIGYCRSVVYKTTGQTSAELTARNKFTNEALDPNGDYINATFTVNLDADGTRWIQFANSSIKNGLTPYTTDTYNIGSATNQWLRLFAKFYYYNGVAWGLDQNNTWTGNNTFPSVTIKDTSVLSNGDYGGALAFRDNQGNRHAYIQPYKNTSGVVNLAIGVDNSGSVQLNSSLIPYATNVLSLGSSSYQWSSVYAQTYYYNGTAWGLDKSNVWTNGQTYSTDSYGQMIWLKNTGLDFSVNGNTGLSSTCQHMIHWCDKNNAIYSSIQSWTASSENTLVLRSYYRTDANTIRDLSVRFTSTATNKVIYPETNADTELGTSTNKWKTLNGINPGILNHVDASVTQVGIDTTGWVLDGSAWNTFNTSSYIDGWLYLSYMQCAVDDYISVRLGSTNYSKPTLLFKAEKLADNKYYIYATIPVTKKFNIYLEIKTSGTLVSHGLYPCLGNV